VLSERFLQSIALLEGDRDHRPVGGRVHIVERNEVEPRGGDTGEQYPLSVRSVQPVEYVITRGGRIAATGRTTREGTLLNDAVGTNDGPT